MSFCRKTRLVSWTYSFGSGYSNRPRKIEAIKSWPQRTNIRDSRSFIGLKIYYRRFIKGFAHIRSPLNKMLQKENHCNDAFERLKLHLTQAPIMLHSSVKGVLILDTEEKGSNIGAVLSQLQENWETVICYTSRTLIKSEQNYCKV